MEIRDESTVAHVPRLVPGKPIVIVGDVTMVLGRQNQDAAIVVKDSKTPHSTTAEQIAS